MLFIGFALVIAVGLALLVSADAGTLVGLTQDQLGQLLPLVAILIFIAGGLFSRRYKFSELFGNLVLWAGIFGVVLVGYTYRDDLTLVASRVFGELMPGIAVWMASAAARRSAADVTGTSRSMRRSTDPTSGPSSTPAPALWC